MQFSPIYLEIIVIPVKISTRFFCVWFNKMILKFSWKMLKSQNDQDLSGKFSFSETETHLNDIMMKLIWFSERLNI